MRHQLSYLFLSASVVTLMAAGKTYAIESSPTPGPSVGHRPVVKNLKLVNSQSKDITQSTTQLEPGDTISLLNATVSDIDGDISGAGAYCIWYKVAVSGGTPIMVYDPGPNDRNCSYTLKDSDIGFRIKNTIKFYSDQSIAINQNYTINPVESVGIDTLSSRIVTTPHPFSGMLSNGTIFSSSSGFPSTGFANASFQLQVNGSSASNRNYEWVTEDPSVVSVNDIGEVFLKSKIVGDVNIVAINMMGGQSYTLRLKINTWYSIFKNVN
ncbi:hypothetical protein CD575_22235, partial [Salmonella enterica]|nr:hypothetical protein [Salmonella enterica]